MAFTLESLAAARDNDYGALSEAYRLRTGAELAGDPFESARCTGPPLTMSASVVIPAWNARDTLASCLVAIEQSSFNARYPDRLEVVVVDDGSTDGTWELLEGLRVNLRLVAIRQHHHSRAHTQNTGIAFAQGDVIVSCDADMILAPFALEELVRRHEACEQLMLIGFRSDVDRSDPRIAPDALPGALPLIAPPFERDVRLHYRPGHGWPESMCRDSGHLRRLGGGRQMWMSDGSRWNLPGMVYGCLFSLRRSDFARMEGYDERFYGWGCEDTLVGVRALALGAHIVPVYGAAGLHVAHGDRSPRKYQEVANNRRIFSAILRAPFEPGDPRWAERARGRALGRFERAPALGRPALDPAAALAALDAHLADPSRRGKHLHALGRFEEAAAAFADVCGDDDARAWARFDGGKALREAGRPDDGAALLHEAVALLPESPWPPVELALALAAGGRFGEARAQLDRAHALDPANPALAFLLHRPPARHRARAAFYARQGQHELAARDYEAALVLEPHHLATQADRALALAAQGRPRDAQAALGDSLARLASDTARDSAAHLELARLHLALGEVAPAKVAVERARRQRPRDPAVAERARAVHAAAARAYPLPLARTIVEQCQAIPGWFGADEAELLVALALRAACSGAPRLVEIGSYCGRATIALALALRGLGIPGARVVAIDEPSLGAAPDGQPPRAVLRAHLAELDLAGMVTLAPEQQPEPWEEPCALLLVDGRHDEAGLRSDLERYLPALDPAGLLVFHDYAPYFPDVVRCVDDLLLGGCSFVAQASSLIALRRQ
jgi:glycosyltransferase involved in cell wall biosynthesis/tetratricopeptide (TPR) repeat protein